jgi:hypothetical protein
MLYISRAVVYYADFIINQPTTALFYNLQHVSAANYLAIIRENAFLRQQVAYDTLVNGYYFHIL